MMSTRYFILLGVFLGLALQVSVSLIAQNRVQLTQDQAKKEFERISNFFDTGDLTMDMEIRSYRSHLSGEMSDIERGKARLCGDEFWSKIMGIETYCDGDIILKVSESEKKVYLSNNVSDVDGDLLRSWSKLFLKQNNVFRWEVDGKIHLSVEYTIPSEYASVELVFNESISELKTILYLAKEVELSPENKKSEVVKPRIEIDLKNIVRKKECAPDSIGFGHILKLENSRWTLQGKYTNFQLVNQSYHTSN